MGGGGGGGVMMEVVVKCSDGDEEFRGGDVATVMGKWKLEDDGE